MPANFDKVGTVTAKSVLKATKHDWNYWVEELDKNGARTWSHQELVALLKKKYKLTVWWQQEVARGYQIAIGKRIAGQTLKGKYTLTVTKTFHCSPSKLWKFITSEPGQNMWLQPMYPIKFTKGSTFECSGGVYGEIKTLVLNKKMRLSWQDEDWPDKTILQLLFVPRASSKCMFVLSQENIASESIKKSMRAKWRKAVDDIYSLS